MSSRQALAVIVSACALMVIPSPATAADVRPDVVNGEPGPSPDFGFLVALGDRDLYQSYGMGRAQFCGGTLASATLVITAAHCVVNSRASDIVVGSPGPDGDLSGSGMTVSNVVSIKVNPKYDAGSQANDIAVVRLATAMDDVPTLTPVTEAEAQTLTAPRAQVMVAGWGSTRGTKPWRYPDVYNVGDLVVFPDSACGGGQDVVIDGVRFTGYGSNDVNPKVMLCAEGVSGGQPVDSCVGDSGGPLVGGTGTARRLVGIVSWGLDNCAVRAGAGVYSRVSAFTSFLMSAGVPFGPGPTDGPQPPTISKVTARLTSLTVTVTPSAAGTQPDSYTVSAQDDNGHVTSCSVVAAARPASARCAINGLATGATYALSAIAVAGDQASAPSEVVNARPVGTPGTPLISYARAKRGGFAGFIVEHINGNGSPITRQQVTCSAAGFPRRSAPIEAGGVALVDRLRAGTTYTCVAVVANTFGRTLSAPRSLRAR